jgi:hypothetical protein
MEWLIRDVLRGAAPGKVPDHEPPPHLAKAQWRFSCECGYRWRTPDTDADGKPLPGLDAVWKNDAWRPPERECLSCHRWVSGTPIR